LWGPVLAWAGLIFWLSSIPDLSSGLEADFLLRKLAHVGVYAVLAALLWRAAGGSLFQKIRAVFFFSFTASALYALSDEWHQSFVPGRGASAADLAIDAAGALMACLWLGRRSR
jgi:VanZ family protein